jgi:hypothetical protein
MKISTVNSLQSVNVTDYAFSHNGPPVRFVLLAKYGYKNISTFFVWTSKYPLTNEAQKYFSMF